MSHMTSGRLTASQGTAIAGGVWHHPRVLRRIGVCSRDDVGRILVGGRAVLVDMENCFGLVDCAEFVVVDEDSDERVVLFVGDSTGGGKSLG